MFRRDGETDGITQQFLEPQPAQRGRYRARDERNLQLALAQTGEHFLRGQIVQPHADVGRFRLKCAQGLRQNSRRERRRVADVQFSAPTSGNGPCCFHRVLRALQYRASFDQKCPACFRQPHGLCAAFQQQEA